MFAFILCSEYTMSYFMTESVVRHKVQVMSKQDTSFVAFLCSEQSFYSLFNRLHVNMFLLFVCPSVCK